MSEAPYKIVGDEDNRWFITDGMVIINDAPFPSKASAALECDAMNQRLARRLARAEKPPVYLDRMA